MTAKPVVLVVEDDFLLLLDARIALEDAGFSVLEAHDAQDALDQFGVRGDIAAMISDIAMPGAIDGVALAHRVRAMRPDVKVVLTTGSPGVPAPPEGVAVIAKPYRTPCLVAEIGAAGSPAA